MRWNRLFRRTKETLTRAEAGANEALAQIEAPVDDDADLRAKNEVFLRKLNAGDYDFVDIGTLGGCGFTIAERQGGRAGLGFELSAHFVRLAQEQGLDVVLQDVCTLDVAGPRVDFAVVSHVLEHLPSLEAIAEVLRALAKLCRGYLLISGPVFEWEEYLEGLGLALVQSLMLDHTCKMTVADLVQILHRLELRDFVIALTEPIANSESIWMHVADQPVTMYGIGPYDAAQHKPKPVLGFDRAIFRDFVCVVKLDAAIECDKILERFYWGFDKVVVRNTWRF